MLLLPLGNFALYIALSVSDVYGFYISYDKYYQSLVIPVYHWCYVWNLVMNIASCLSLVLVAIYVNKITKKASSNLQ